MPWSLPLLPPALREIWIDAGDQLSSVADLPGLAALAPPDIVLELDPDSWVRGNDGAVSVHIDASLLAERDRSTVGVLQRDLHLHAGVAVHENFGLDPHWQGALRGRRALCSAVTLYLALGLERVELDAADAGAYVWARCGFDFADDQSREEVIQGAETLLRRLDLEAELEQIRHPWDFSRITTKVSLTQLAGALEDRPPLLDLGALGDPSTQIGLGKALLLAGDHAGWRGALDLSASSQGLVQLARYAGLNGTANSEASVFHTAVDAESVSSR